MVKCDKCGEELDYLPFKCRYCGKQFCKAHRLAENHDCSFEFKHNPYAVKQLVPQNYQVYEDAEVDSVYDDPAASDMGQYRNRRTARSQGLFGGFGTGTPLKATYSIMIIQVVFMLLASFPIFQPHLFLSADGIKSLFFHTLLTSMFNPGDWISLIFNLIILYFVGKTVEGRFGSKIFIQTYIISGLITGGMLILLEMIFGLIPGITPEVMSYAFDTTSGAIMGIIAFVTFLLPDTTVRVFLMFIPIKLRTRNLLWFFIGFYVFFGVIDLVLFVGNPENGGFFFIYFAAVFGALGGYLIFKSLRASMGF